MKIGIESMKEKLDEQSRILEEEESSLKEQWDYYRRSEDKLRTMKQKIDIIQGKNRFEDADDTMRNALMSELQIDYDKYLKLYQKDVVRPSKHSKHSAFIKE